MNLYADFVVRLMFLDPNLPTAVCETLGTGTTAATGTWESVPPKEQG